MARRQLTPDDLDALRTLAQQLGKVVAKRAFGPEGPGLDVDFTAMEEVAVQAAQAFSQGTLEGLLDQHAQHLPDTHPCPTCGRVAAARLEPRPLVVRGALIEHREPVCYCPSCRRDFFPSASPSETGQSRL